MPSEEDRMGMRGPGKSLIADKLEAVRKIQERMEEMRGERGDGPSCHVSLAPLAVKVNNLIHQRDELCRLCGEIIATFELPANQEKFAALGPQFVDILAGWVRRFQKNSGEA